MKNVRHVLTKKYALVVVSVVAGAMAMLSGAAVSALGTVYFDDSGSTASTCDIRQWDGTGVNCSGHSARVKATNTGQVPRGMTTVRIYFQNIPTNASGRPDGSANAFTNNLIKFTIQGTYACPDYLSGANNRDNWAVGYFGPGNPGGVPSGNRIFTDYLIDNYYSGSGQRTARVISNVGEYRSSAAYCDVSGANYSTNVAVNPTNLQSQPGFASDIFYVELVVQPHTRVRTLASGATSYDSSGYDTSNGFPGWFQGNSCNQGANVQRCDGVANAFRVTFTGTSYDWKIATASKSAADQGAGAADYNVTMQNGNPNLDTTYSQVSTQRHFAYLMRFGADCTVPQDGSPVTKEIDLYDVDHSNQSHGGPGSDGDKIKIILLRTDSDGNKYTLNMNPSSSLGYDNTKSHPDNPGTWSSKPAGWTPDYFASEAEPIQSGTNRDQYIKFQARAGDVYIIYMLDVRSDLVNQFGLPFDGIYYERPCDHPPSGTIDVSCNSTTGLLDVSATFQDGDRSSGNTRARIRYDNPSSGLNGVQPSSGFTPVGTSYNWSGLSPGTFSLGTTFTLEVSNWIPTTGGGSYGAAVTISPAATTVAADYTDCSVTMSCDLTGPDEADPQSPSINISFRGYAASPATPQNPSTLQLTGPGGYNVTQNFSLAGAGPNFNSSISFARPAAGFDVGTYNGTATFITNLGQTTCPITVLVGQRPFLSVYGGDVLAGAYARVGACQPSPGSAVTSWNHDNQTPYTDYAGAGAAPGVFATGEITSFTSWLNTNGTANNALKPIGLSFANSGAGIVDVNSALYGGNFGGVPTDCAFGVSTDSTITNTTINNNYGGANLANNTDVYYYITGQNVYINGNVTYASRNTGYPSVDAIPSFKLIVVGGNIYIDNNVTELDGIYVAEPDGSGSGGEIYTCATAANTPVDTTSAAALRNNCATQLKVYGAFAAKKVYFDRSYGTVGSAQTSHTWTNDQAAEVFIYSPETWLPNGSGGNSLAPVSYHGLPPVL